MFYFLPSPHYMQNEYIFSNKVMYISTELIVQIKIYGTNLKG